MPGRSTGGSTDGVPCSSRCETGQRSPGIAQGITPIGPEPAGVPIDLVPMFASILATAIPHEAFQGSRAVALGPVLEGSCLSERAGRA